MQGLYVYVYVRHKWDNDERKGKVWPLLCSLDFDNLSTSDRRSSWAKKRKLATCLRLISVHTVKRVTIIRLLLISMSIFQVTSRRWGDTYWRWSVVTWVKTWVSGHVLMLLSTWRHQTTTRRTSTDSCTTATSRRRPEVLWMTSSRPWRQSMKTKVSADRCGSRQGDVFFFFYVRSFTSGILSEHIITNIITGWRINRVEHTVRAVENIGVVGKWFTANRIKREPTNRPLEKL